MLLGCFTVSVAELLWNMKGIKSEAEAALDTNTYNAAQAPFLFLAQLVPSSFPSQGLCYKSVLPTVVQLALPTIRKQNRRNLQ